jgi:dihydrofolate synthase/folylpolyglutamate synthase
MQSLEYSQIIKEIESLGIMPDRVPSLEPMHEGLRRLFSDPTQIPKEKVVVVAGTNGKGSVCATLEALLLNAGQSVALYTSPHLEETTERFRINGEDISTELFCLAYQKVSEKISDLKVSHFEILTLMAAWLFFSYSPRIDWFLFEVGLGGTWDATNAIPHQYSVITTLGFDHQNLLGSTLESIANNKFGIVHSENQVIHSPFDPQIQSLVLETQKKTHSTWRQSLPFQLQVRNQDIAPEPKFFMRTVWGEAQLTLPGSRGAQNTATALTTFQELGFSPQAHLSALEQVRWPGRMEQILHPISRCPIYFSGDHNPSGVQSLIEILSYYRWDHLHILAGIGKDKDLDGTLAPLFDLPKSSVLLTVTPFKGRSIEDYGRWAERAAEVCENPVSALTTIARKAEKRDLVLVTGSLYLVGLLKKHLRGITSPSC